MGNSVLEIENLRASFRIKGDYYAAVDGVSLTVHENEVVAIVGESGCGKSALALSIMGLHNLKTTKLEGQVNFQSQNLLSLSPAKLNKVRGKDIGMIFQDPMTALNPLATIGRQIEEPMDYHMKLSSAAKKKRTMDLLRRVGIKNEQRIYGQYPHELSGGMRQRVIIAIALACDPVLLIADEPTTALDVTIQAQIMDLLKELQNQIKSGIILITHDLGVVAEMADRVAVMYAGEVVEIAEVRELFMNPLHPYTRSLLNSIPSNMEAKAKLHVIEGIVPSIQNLDRIGCRFAPRVAWVPEEDHETNPQMHEVKPNHFVRCTCYKNFHFPEGRVGEKDYVAT
ncbi:ABC transporter ATP-binding protein [Sporosarcina limicola]|uniref:Peptide/nickel transport system ATP-binding protein n=1 Tax=Sporosarcina limicola TaxID=34101 RepID=A0A927MEX0_9BACL|nr:ABC transporter ATP-binding protein [Sporosarcina limicola]MBE1553310.1 peptide/nickel transport system ATP-binding protein [Sporosarcina limicola]